MDTMWLTAQRSRRIADMPEDYRVVGVGRGCRGRRGTWWRPPGEFSQVREAVTSGVVVA
jgi:hypothetical protein